MTTVITSLIVGSRRNPVLDLSSCSYLTNLLGSMRMRGISVWILLDLRLRPFSRTDG